MNDFKAESRKQWFATQGATSTEQIALGCQQRIADAAERTAAASELMASNFLKLQNELAQYKRWWNEERETTKRLRLTITNLKGQVTKAKRKGGAAE